MAAAGDGTTAGDRPLEPTTEVSGDPDAVPPRRWSWPGPVRLLSVAAVLVVALGVVAVMATLSHPARLGFAFSGAEPPARWPATDPGGVGAAEAAAAQTATAPLAGRRRATFELVDALAMFGLRAADLGDELYRIEVPADGGVTPRAEVRGDRVRLRAEENGRRGPAAVQVQLNSRVEWRLRLVGAVSDQLLDLGAGRLAGVELTGGSSRTELLLPRLAGALTVRMTGGVSQLSIRVPDAVPVRVRAGAGAGSVAVYLQRRDGVAAGELVSSPTWDRAAGRLYVDLVAGANTVTVAEG
ncbi:hypothetical protein [Micromonospora coerulea]|uniref:hypothetical protein n=1 Tax=Micromonospora coerulea TaxID=47856 RepID=UPI001F3EF417|nr:hypothetical protein [Micromonospora veneta]